MDLDRWRLVDRVLDHVLASDPSGWPALVEDLCGGDLELRSEVEGLLAQRSAAEKFLTSPPSVADLALVADKKPVDEVDVTPIVKADVIPGTKADVIPSEAKDPWPPGNESKDSSLRSD